MIQATEADVGRRVIYDARPAIKHLSHGTVVGLDGRYVVVRFDGDDYPPEARTLRVGSNLRWAK